MYVLLAGGEGLIKCILIGCESVCVCVMRQNVACLHAEVLIGYDSTYCPTLLQSMMFPDWN